MTKQIPLSGKKGAGMFALVDDADYEELSQYKWHLFSGAYANRNLLQSEEGQGGMLMHRQILRIPGGIDHKDGDGLNNTRDNLRPANQSQNNMNAKPRKNSTSQYKGVYWNSYHGKWSAHIHVDGRKVYIGRYATQREAALAYNQAAALHFGEYARLNEIVDDLNDLPVSEPRPPQDCQVSRCLLGQ